MDYRDVSLLPPHFTRIKKKRFAPDGRLWQSAPSAAMTKGGRIFCVYSADNSHPDEVTTNYTVCAYSDNGGESYELAFYAYHDYEVRMSETLLFMSPEGVLYHFWTQSYKYFDGRGGIWCVKCENPDADIPKFTRPKRICDGFMADNPVVMRDGRWMFPSSVWTHITPEIHHFPEYEKASVWQSLDKGKTLSYVGGVVTPVPDFTENTVFEKADGTLVMLFRTESYAGGINISKSKDGGKTWSEPKPFVIPGPSSRFMVSRFPSGNLLIVTHHEFTGRNNLTALLSDDDGETWRYPLLLDERNSVSYPSGNITPDGKCVLCYDRERTGAKEILLASFTEEDMRNGSFGKNSFTKKLVCKGGTDTGV
ncbi:MAG: exo-alpha-sialidase [Clostridia bacterium]|nr:exo-alpha-sialidase [Clostridia bacterium]